MKYRVIIQPSTEAQIRDIYHFLLETSPSYAERWIAGMEAAIESLSEMPFRCRIAREEFRIQQDTRQLLHRSYRILFSVRGQEVWVVRIEHTRQRPLRLRPRPE